MRTLSWKLTVMGEREERRKTRCSGRALGPPNDFLLLYLVFPVVSDCLSHGHFCQ